MPKMRRPRKQYRSAQSRIVCLNSAGVGNPCLMLSLTSNRISRLSACWPRQPTSASKGRTCGRTLRAIFVNCTTAARTGPKQQGTASAGARERYHWSGNRVVGTTRDSNVFQAGGTWTLIAELRHGDGSHVRVILDRRWKSKGWLFYPMVALFKRAVVLRQKRTQLRRECANTRPRLWLVVRRPFDIGGRRSGRIPAGCRGTRRGFGGRRRLSVRR
jgi:hypothetical protein